MASVGQTGPTDREVKQPEGLSQFMGKVLDQLSLTSWLPAVMLVGVAALLIQCHDQGNTNIALAVSGLTTHALGTIVVLLVSVVLAAVVTQAFSFGTIRLLEGYWSAGGPVSRLVRWRTRAWNKRRQRLEKRVQRCRSVAFGIACTAMKARNIPDEWIDVLEDDFNQVPAHRRRPHGSEILVAARELDWQEFADASLLNELDRAERRLGEFPDPHRLLPTCLGNVLRAHEDQLVGAGYNLEGLVMRRHGNIPERLLVQHDQFRDRLDMYCTFVPVFAGLAVGAAGLLADPDDHFVSAIVACLALLLLCWTSYRAAIASARGYAVALDAIAKIPESNGAAEASN